MRLWTLKAEDADLQITAEMMGARSRAQRRKVVANLKNQVLESVSCSASGAAGGSDADGSGEANIPACIYDTPSAAKQCTTSAAPEEAVSLNGSDDGGRAVSGGTAAAAMAASAPVAACSTELSRCHAFLLPYGRRPGCCYRGPDRGPAAERKPWRQRRRRRRRGCQRRHSRCCNGSPGPAAERKQCWQRRGDFCQAIQVSSE